MSVHKIKIGALLGICIVFLSQYNALCEYTIEGIGVFGQANPKFPPMRFNLTLESRDKEYRITAKAIDGEWHDDEITAGDGLDNYFLDQSWPTWEAKNKNENYTESGTVIEGNFPANSLSIVQLAWLTYCSASNLHIGTNSMTIPLRCTKYAPTEGLIQIVSFATSSPNTVDKIQCFSQGVLNVLDGKKKVILKPPYNGGYLLWEIQITTFTNAGGLMLPRSFEYAQYFPSGTNSSEPNCVIRAEFEVTNITDKVFSQSLLPEITQKNMRIADWRFNRELVPMDASGKMVTPVAAYQADNGQWRKRDDSGVRDQVLALQQVVHIRQPAKGGFIMKAFTFSALILSTLFLGYFIKREIKNNKEKDKNI